MYKIKDVAKRGTALAAAFSLLAGVSTSLLPGFASADALNPLTHRSLLLSSSSPGWSYTDGSNNPTYAPPNSGANGQKSGETFSFNVSSTTTIKGFTFQYCTTAAGNCYGPGNDTADPGGVDDASHSDFNVVTSTPAELTGAQYTAVSGSASGVPNANGSQGNFVVLVNGAISTATWTMTSSHVETTNTTGKNNYISLSSAAGQSLTANDAIKVVFFATNANYMTNPGAGAFFVKINDYNSDTVLDSTTLVDGGVTVANIMNQSIQIQTKVLETMDFSVGTVDPDTLTPTELSTATAGARTAHGQCDPVLTAVAPANPHNSLLLGNSSAENSLETAKTYATHSYWRLSSNSSGGATVYYAGNTLANTEGDKIAPVGVTAAAPLTGTPQFGLAIDNATTGNFLVDDSTPNANVKDTGVDDATTNKGSLDSTAATGWVAYQAAHAASHNPQLFPLVANAQYTAGQGVFDTTDGTINTQFAFDPNANTVPRAIASENTVVVDCVTAKMRYVGNIAATTPAGIYTTKINYLAAPQY
jgi:hypothetical protein